MKNEMFKYIEYSLFVHNYSVIPGFGGFILNLKSVSGDIDVKPSTFTIVFNPDLNHDDGVLVSYIVRDAKSSYNVASQIIKDFVKDLKNNIQSGQTIDFGFGKILLDKDGIITFVPNSSIVHPSFYGLMPVRLQYLSDIEEISQKAKRNIILRNFLGGVAAVAIGVCLFIVPSIDVSDKNNGQEASFIHSLTNSISLPMTSVKSDFKIKSDVPVLERKSEKTYYIIVGGEDSKSQAEALCGRIKQSGFENAAIVDTNGRYRIFIASFSDKTEAESFLKVFRKENSKYETAWLYSKKN